MAVYSAKIQLPVSTRAAFEWLTRPGAFERLQPPWERGELIGKQAELELRKSPFVSWAHSHQLLPDGEDRCMLEDSVEYRLRLGCLFGCAARKRLERLFRFRHGTMLRDLERHQRFADQGTLRIAVTGASGLVGSSLFAFLSSGGHDVSRLVRRTAGRGEIEWNPGSSRVDTRALEGIDAVVHLAGENVGSGRWTEGRKQAILTSRVEGTRLLSEALAGLEQKPSVLISASAIGYYGNQGDAWIEEGAMPGKGFLADVAREWEAASAPAREAGIRVVTLRIGVVLTPAGGALSRMLPPFRLGLGGRAGRGDQFMSWIALDDLVGVIHHLLFHHAIEGPVNAVAPNPVTNTEFSHTLANVLHRPALFPLPGAAIRLALGEMGQALLLEGARVKPAVLRTHDFPFLHPRLEDALRAELGY